ncbi:MAG: AMP-dependent synthetase [Flavobacteriaceae bacterium]|nr:AMP-dependent synthetase [Flavobacteriaceae bacterium]
MSINNKYHFKFYDWEEKFKNKPFLRQPFGDDWEEYSWGQTGLMARKLATGLKSLGLPKGSHIGLMSKNCREWIIADLAIIMAGYVSVPFFPNLKSNEIKNLLEFGDVKALFVGKVEDWAEIKKGISDDIPIIAFPHYEHNSKIDKGYQWSEFIEKHEPQMENYHPNLDDVWTIIFTSGTTGNPKGVVLNYKINQNTDVMYTKEYNPLCVDFKGNNTFFSYLPMNHIAERIAIEFTAFKNGGVISFTESIDTFVKNLSEVQPSVFFGVPRIYTKFQLGILSNFSQKKLDLLLSIPVLSIFIKNILKKKLGLGKAKVIVSGAAAMQVAQRDWFKKIGVNITIGYGMTENCAVTTQLPGSNFNKPGSVGTVQPNVEIKIDQNTEEILMRGPYVMLGYYNDTETTNNTIKNGWLHTGDKGLIDSDGHLYITGRVKDTFKTSKGEFIDPAKIKAKFGEVEYFDQICVVGLGVPQPLMLVNISDIGKKLKEEELINKLIEKLESVNSELFNYKRVSTIIICKDNWTPQNGILTPTMKIKRGNVDKTYLDKYDKWHNEDQKIIWE